MLAAAFPQGRKIVPTRQATFSRIAELQHLVAAESPGRGLACGKVGPVMPVTLKSSSRRECPAPAVAFAALLLIIGATPAQAIPNSRIEEFDNTIFKDAVNTTADWNTAAGKLQIFPFRPTLLGSYDTPGNAYDVALSGTVAYVADGLSGIRIVDVSNPASPILLGSFDTPGDAVGIAVAGTRCYVADNSSGLLMFNIGNPSSPTL